MLQFFASYISEQISLWNFEQLCLLQSSYGHDHFIGAGHLRKILPTGLMLDVFDDALAVCRFTRFHLFLHEM